MAAAIAACHPMARTLSIFARGDLPCIHSARRSPPLRRSSGWTIGGGTEVALGPNWSAKLEYLYVDLGTVNNTVVVTGAPSLTDSARVQMNVVRAGVNYRF